MAGAITENLPAFSRIANFFGFGKRNREKLLSQFTGGTWFWQTGSASGETISDLTTLGIPAFYRAVQVISDTIAGLKLEVEQVDAEGNITKLPNHPLMRVLNEPSPLYNKFTWRATNQAYAIIRGNAYCFIRRDPRTLRPVELRIVEPGHCEPYLNSRGELYYRVTHDTGRMEIVEWTEMVHIPNLALKEDNIEGLSTIGLFRNSLGLPISMTKWAGKTFKDGSPLQGLLSTDKAMSREQLDQATDQWKAQLGRGNTPILPGGLKFQAITLSPEDALFVDNYKLTVADVANITGVPLHMLSQLDRATFSNIEEQSREFVQNTIRPWVKRWESELNRKLLYEREKGKIRIRFNMESLLRGNQQTQADYLSKMVLNGIMSRNEARKYIGLNTMDGLDEMPMPVQFLQDSNQENNSNEE